MTGSKGPSGDHVSNEFFYHSSGQRIDTDAVIVDALRKQYPDRQIIVVDSYNCDLLGYASTGQAVAIPIKDGDGHTLEYSWRRYLPPRRRMDGAAGFMVTELQFGKYMYAWGDKEFVLYVVNGRDGTVYSPHVINQYLVGSSQTEADGLIRVATEFSVQLHNEIWVFDQGYWQKSAELWKNVQKASWDDVILDEGMKKAVKADVEKFFDSRDTYGNLKVPWKRGAIFYGPPGNGKTISIKATMKMLYERKDPVPTLYVRTLASFGGPEYSLNQIFGKARQQAPCYLVFEDLDTIISEQVRSYFFNQVDGLEPNDGIFMVGSTNHLDRLDPGVVKRPSRFDRKFLFPDPNFDERVKYCKFWQAKLASNKDIEFPDNLCTAIAHITDKFSFAYIQEAFVAALLSIAARADDERMSAGGGVDPVKALAKVGHLRLDENKDLDKLLLWREIKKQIELLREELGNDE